MVRSSFLAREFGLMEIKDRLVLITGASSGIGAATAKAMTREGGRVILLARRRSALEETADEVRKMGGRAWVYPVRPGRRQGGRANRTDHFGRSRCSRYFDQQCRSRALVAD